MNNSGSTGYFLRASGSKSLPTGLAGLGKLTG